MNKLVSNVLRTIYLKNIKYQNLTSRIQQKLKVSCLKVTAEVLLQSYGKLMPISLG